MAIGSGLSGQLGVKAESTYGTAVTVDRFYEFDSEGIEPDVATIDVQGIRAGSRFQRTDRTARIVRGYAGSITMPILNKNMGLLFQHAFGDDTITTITGTARRHTITPADQAGKFLTLQMGKPSVDGTVQPFTYNGGKIVGVEMMCGVDEALKATFDFDFKGASTATSLATASYVASQEAFYWPQAGVTVAGSTFYAKGFKCKYTPNLAVDRRFLGNTKKEPLIAGFGSIEGELDAEFESLTEYTNFIAGTQQALVITFTTTSFITGSTPYVFKITVPKANWMDAAPSVTDTGILKLTLPFRGEDDGTNAPITVTLDNADTAA